MVVPSVLVIDRSAEGAGVSESSWLLLPPLGSLAAPATLAVLSRLPVAEGEIVHDAV